MASGLTPTTPAEDAALDAALALTTRVDMEAVVAGDLATLVATDADLADAVVAAANLVFALRDTVALKDQELTASNTLLAANRPKQPQRSASGAQLWGQRRG